MSNAFNQTATLPNTVFGQIRAQWLTLVAKVTLMKNRQARYSKTFNELSALSNRDLADIGIARSNIAKLAHQESLKVK